MSKEGRRLQIKARVFLNLLKHFSVRSEQELLYVFVISLCGVQSVVPVWFHLHKDLIPEKIAELRLSFDRGRLTFLFEEEHGCESEAFVFLLEW